MVETLHNKSLSKDAAEKQDNKTNFRIKFRGFLA